MAEGLMEAPPSDVRLGPPDLRNPLGSIEFVKGTEYMHALSELGYNVENMTSPLPLMTKIAQAGSNLLDMGRNNQLEYQKAQADLAYKTAQARNTDAEAATNETLLGSRLKLLQNQADEAATRAKIASSTADDQIKISGLNRQAKELEVQQAKDGVEKANAIQAKWESEYKNFPSGLNNPDYPTQRDQWYEKNGDLVLNPGTSAQVQKWRETQDKIYGQQADNQISGAMTAEITKAQAEGNLPLHLPKPLEQMSSDEKHDLIIKKNLKVALGQMRSALSTLPEVPQRLGDEDRASPEEAAIRARLQNASNQIESYLGSDDSLKLIKGGQMPNINANGIETDDFARALSDYQAYTARAAAAQTVTNPPVKVTAEPPKGKEGVRAEYSIPFDEAVRRGIIDAQGRPITPAAAGQPMNEEEKAFRNQQATNAIRAAPGNVGIQRVAEAYAKGQISAEQFAQQIRAFQRTGPQAAPTPGGQFGGLVTSGGINGPQAGLGRARGGLIPPAAVAGYAQGYQEGGPVSPTQGANADVAPNLSLGSTDTVPAMLSPGEFVLNAGAVKDIGLPMLEAMNQSPSSETAQSDVENVATPLLLGEAGQVPPQMSAPPPIALPPVAQPGTGQWPHVAATPPRTQTLAPRAELAAAPPAAAPHAQAAGSAPAIATAQEAPGTSSSLAGIRSSFAKELADPETRRLLMASTEAEVGDQPQAQQAYIESVMNRASARGQSLRSVLLDPGYYPASTKNKLSSRMSQEQINRYDPLINDVLAGSNVSNLATGNESGRVHSGGAQVTFNPQTGERFVAENDYVGWRNNLLAAGGYQTGGLVTQGSNFGTVPPLRPYSDRRTAVQSLM